MSNGNEIVLKSEKELLVDFEKMTRIDEAEKIIRLIEGSSPIHEVEINYNDVVKNAVIREIKKHIKGLDK